jgi:hypothetical protein
LPFLVEGRFGESGAVNEGLLGSAYTGSFGGSGGGLESELNLKAFTVDIVVRDQPSFDPTLIIIDGRLLF